ncbi:MAG: zinc dependent phospholipase C family protein [Halanaerobiaceae bacterium]
MNILTHILMSRKVYPYVNKFFSYDLSLAHLIWGSIKPDLTNSDISHCKNETFYLFYKKLEFIQSLNIKENRDRYSLELGEISHYLCDYFCYAHNNKELLKYLAHISYEKNLHKTAKKIGDQLYYTGYSDFSYLTFLEMIEHKHRIYLATTPSYENDIIYSYEIILSVSYKLAKEANLISNTEKIEYPYINAL